MILLIIYLAGFVVSARIAARVVLADQSYCGREPDGEDIFFSIFLGALIGAMWPIVAPGYLIYNGVRKVDSTSRNTIMRIFFAGYGKKAKS